MHDPQETGGNTDDTTVSPAPRRRIRHDRTTWLALGTAGIALVVALFSVLVSAVALHRSSNTHTVAAGSTARPSVSPTDTSGGDPPTSAQTSTDNPVVSTTDASVPTDSETIDPKADYTIAYRGERLRIQPTCVQASSTSRRSPAVTSTWTNRGSVPAAETPSSATPTVVGGNWTTLPAWPRWPR